MQPLMPSAPSAAGAPAAGTAGPHVRAWCHRARAAAASCRTQRRRPVRLLPLAAASAVPPAAPSSNLSEFIVIRDINTVRRSTGLNIGTALLQPGSAAAADMLSLLPQPLVKVETLSPRDLRSAAADPAVLHVARPLPLRLIEPVPDATADNISGEPEPAEGATWGIQAVGADTSPYTGAGVKVAVLDTGVDLAHAAFQGVNIKAMGFTADGPAYTVDDDGHGTHCLGTVLGRDVAGKRIGVARGVTEALVGKVLPARGKSAAADSVFNGMLWAASEGAQVISMSLGFDAARLVRRFEEQWVPVNLAIGWTMESIRHHFEMYNSVIDIIEKRAVLMGGSSPVIIAAAGNESRRDIMAQYEIGLSVPAVNKGVISVGALKRTAAGLEMAEFSNTGPTLSAPGYAVMSALANSQDGLDYLSGTSMATPHVAGVAALWWQQLSEGGAARPTAASVAAALRSSCTVKSLGKIASGDTLDRGDGLVQAPQTR